MTDSQDRTNERQPFVVSVDQECMHNAQQRNARTLEEILTIAN